MLAIITEICFGFFYFFFTITSFNTSNRVKVRNWMHDYSILHIQTSSHDFVVNFLLNKRQLENLAHRHDRLLLWDGNQVDPLSTPEVVRISPKMATSPSTPTSGTLTPKKKDESFLEKIGTLARKKKIKEGNF